MSEKNYESLKQEICDLKDEIRNGFEAIRSIQDWKQSADVGMKGNDEHGVWGYRQKIDYNRDKISETVKRLDGVEMKVNKIIWTAIGAATVAGTVAAIIFSLVQSVIGV